MVLTKSLKRNNEFHVSRHGTFQGLRKRLYINHVPEVEMGEFFPVAPFTIGWIQMHSCINPSGLMQIELMYECLNFTPYFQTEWPLQTLPWLLGKLIGKGYGDIACSACLTRMGSHWVISPNSVVSQKMTGRFSSYIQNSFVQKNSLSTATSLENNELSSIYVAS